MIWIFLPRGDVFTGYFLLLFVCVSNKQKCDNALVIKFRQLSSNHGSSLKHVVLRKIFYFWQSRNSLQIKNSSYDIIALKKLGIGWNQFLNQKHFGLSIGVETSTITIYAWEMLLVVIRKTAHKIENKVKRLQGSAC